VHYATGADGMLRIQVDVQNRTDWPKPIAYRVDWLDQNGKVLDVSASPPITWTLDGKEATSIAVTAPTPLARDFRIKFSGAVN
jgi:uncharacterized protein YcfL